MYRDSGMLTVLNGELPDYLPLVLEFCALVDRRGSLGLAGVPSFMSLRLAMKDACPTRVVAASARPFPASPETQGRGPADAGYGPPSRLLA